MNLFKVDKNICMRICVSHENQERMRKYTDASFRPLFVLRREQFLSVRLEYASFTCTYQGQKKVFTYEDIQKAETVADGLIIYFNDGNYLSIATEKREKHNSALCDIVLFLKRRCRKVFFENEEISYPEDSEARYKSNKQPLASITFELSDSEIGRLLLYDYLIGEKMLGLIIPIFIGFLAAIVLHNVWIALLAGLVVILALILTRDHLTYKDSYAQNHKGHLHALLYDELLVISLHNTDLELEYNTLKRLKSICGLWRMRSGDFFVFVLPARIEQENQDFFNTLYKMIKQ